MLKDKKVIIFDLDGTVIDSVNMYNEIYVELIKEFTEKDVTVQEIQDDWDWIGLAKKCNENRCHLHVYPAPSCWKNPKYKEKYSEYFELDRNYEYFHLHEPIPYNQLLNALAQYDYGIHPMKVVDENSKARRYGYYNEYKPIYAPVNHLWDYIGAGIPIVARYPLKLMELFEQMGVSINFTTDEYDFDFLKKNRFKYRENVNSVKEKFYVNNMIGDLLKWICP